MINNEFYILVVPTDSGFKYVTYIELNDDDLIMNTDDNMSNALTYSKADSLKELAKSLSEKVTLLVVKVNFEVLDNE